LFSFACGPNVAVSGETDDGSTTTADSDDTSGGLDDWGSWTDSGGPGGEDGVATVPSNRAIDILFVVDNSGSMDRAQANLAAGIGSFVEALGDTDYRIAITTTDMGNYWCADSTPEAGSFVLSSCRSRLGDFTFGDVSAETTCTDVCDLETLDVGQAWIESTAGVTNLPAGVSATQALQCALPQGINGCGFESPLEAMKTSLRRIAAPGESESGFLRADAVLAVVFVTDEADCSFNPDHQTIVFGEAGVGNQVFWSLPDQQAAPTSAVCWNAGVDCDFTVEGDECHAADKDVDGNAVSGAAAETEAALYPVESYRATLQQLEDMKQTLAPNQEIIIAGIVGAPENYPQVHQLSYAQGPNGDDPASFQAQFGIGQGCTSQITEAVPPVRMRSLAESFLVTENDSNLFSVCSSDYGPALGAIGHSIREQIRPSCMPVCVDDGDAVTVGLQPICTVVQSVTNPDGTITEQSVVECPDGVLPPTDEVCYRPRTDADLSDACRDAGWNLEFEFIRNGPAPEGATLTGVCEPSGNTALDCPLLPG